jgi:hypothetical protein
VHPDFGSCTWRGDAVSIRTGASCARVAPLTAHMFGYEHVSKGSFGSQEGADISGDIRRPGGRIGAASGSDEESLHGSLPAYTGAAACHSYLEARRCLR